MERSTLAEPLERVARRRRTPASLVFVGGTGRSGTHVVARLLGRHPHFKNIPMEARFHVDAGGFPDLLAGRVTPEAFIRRLETFWWHRRRGGGRPPDLPRWLPTGGRPRGLHKLIPGERLHAAVERFRAGYHEDPEAACRGLFLELLWPIAEERGNAGLIEMSCDTVAEAPTLERLFPEARFIHVVRDGRDASASRVAQGRGILYPRTRRQGLEWWEERVRRIDRGVRQVPGHKVLVLSLDELLGAERREVFKSARKFAGVRADPRVRRFFRQRVSRQRANVERWRRGLSKRRQRAIEREYEATLERLAADGVHCTDVLRRTFERRSKAAPSPDGGRRR